MSQMIQNLPTMKETQVRFLVQKDPLEEGWLLTPLFLPGEFHGQRSLASYSPWSHKQSDTTERLTYTHTHIYVIFLYVHIFSCRVFLGTDIKFRWKFYHLYFLPI